MNVPEMTATVTFDGSRATLTVVGEIDYDTMPRLREALAACFADDPSRIHVDLSGVTFCDCAGLNALLWARQRTRRTGAVLDVDGVRAPIVIRLFEIVGAGELFRARSATA